jgi:hypothetical protein
VPHAAVRKRKKRRTNRENAFSSCTLRKEKEMPAKRLRKAGNGASDGT